MYSPEPPTLVTKSTQMLGWVWLNVVHHLYMPGTHPQKVMGVAPDLQYEVVLVL